ncbi:MAG: hypothetical protein PVG78_14595 [Desulfobacterales bacterium]|jgi:hypothetical protein
MKRVICVLVVMSLAAFLGCAKQAPEDAAKAIVEKLIATKHQGFVLDTSDLEYKVVEQGEDFARVSVSGEIEVKGEIALVKEGNRWIVGGKPAVPEKAAAPSAQTVPAVTKTAETGKQPTGH